MDLKRSKKFELNLKIMDNGDRICQLESNEDESGRMNVPSRKGKANKDWKLKCRKAKNSATTWNRIYAGNSNLKKSNVNTNVGIKLEKREKNECKAVSKRRRLIGPNLANEKNDQIESVELTSSEAKKTHRNWSVVSEENSANDETPERISIADSQAGGSLSLSEISQSAEWISKITPVPGSRLSMSNDNGELEITIRIPRIALLSYLLEMNAKRQKELEEMIHNQQERIYPQ